MQAQLSIITINFNNLEGLKKTAESVINQTWKEFEWIIIDGGSTDGSKEYIVKLNNDLTRNGWNPMAYWCSEPDKGIYNAMNKGIVKACGEYLNFMNSGDCYYDKNTLENLFSRNYNSDIIEGIALREDSLQPFHNRYPNQTPLQMLMLSSFYHQASFIKRHLQLRNMYDENLRIVSDWKFFLTVLVKENIKVKMLGMPLAVVNVDGISSNCSDIQNKERKQVLQELFGEVTADALMHYSIMSMNILVRNLEYLRINHSKLYILCRRIVSVVTTTAKLCFRNRDKKYGRI